MSTSPTLPLFGRVWSLQVLTAPGLGSQQTLLDVSTSTGADDSNALRIVFDVHMSVGHALWEAHIKVYNLDLTTIGLITQGAEVSLSIGYEANGEPTEIWRGFVFQPTFQRENVTDFVLTLHCMVGLPELVNNIVNVTTGPVANQWEIVQRMAQAAGINIAHIDNASSFSQQQLPRGKTIFGSPSRLFGQIAAQNNLLSFYTPQGLMIGKPTGASSTPDITYAPPLGNGQQPSSDEASITRSLIGSPQQTQDGVLFRVLGDPRLQIKLPLMQAKLDQAVIRQMPFTYGALPSLGSILNQDGVYYVVMVNHLGDSRGNDWYTEVIGVTSVNSLFALIGTGSSLL
jgi:hypothetical protein